MSTRIKESECESAKTTLIAVLNNGVRFLECPLSDEEKGIFWHRGFPDDLLDAYATLNEHGVGVEYSAVTRAVGFVVPDAVRPTAIRLTMQDSQRGFFTITRKMMDNFPKVALLGDSDTMWPSIPLQEIQLRMGPKAHDFMQWTVATATMDAEIQNAVKVLEDIFGMVKTAGQLKRMVPDLFQYLPAPQQAAFAEQKRASQLPNEWTPYDRQKVDDMLITINKCHLLNGMSKPGMESASLETDQFSWSSFRELAPVEATAK